MESSERIICQQALKRIAWRLQYRTRKRRKNEIVFIPDHIGFQTNPYAHLISQMSITELIEKVPSTKGRFILKRLYMEGYLESEIARELNISQQAVSKWKRKSLQFLAQIMNSTPCS